MDGSPLRWGILGTGGIAHAFASDLRLTESGVVSAVGSKEVDAEVRMRHIENGVQRGAHRVLVLAPVRRRVDYPRGGQVIAHVHDDLEQRIS